MDEEDEPVGAQAVFGGRATSLLHSKLLNQQHTLQPPKSKIGDVRLLNPTKKSRSTGIRDDESLLCHTPPDADLN